MIPIRRTHEPAPAPSAPDDVVGRLVDCHARIRRFLAEARLLASGTGDRERRRASAQAVERYFRIALPLHEADEDASIAPRLPSRAMPVALDRMDEHGAIDVLVDALCEDWRRWADDPEASVDLVAHGARLEALASGLERHLEVEERMLFPFIARMPVEERRAIVREMAERRRI